MPLKVFRYVLKLKPDQLDPYPGGFVNALTKNWENSPLKGKPLPSKDNS